MLYQMLSRSLCNDCNHVQSQTAQNVIVMFVYLKTSSYGMSPGAPRLRWLTFSFFCWLLFDSLEVMMVKLLFMCTLFVVVGGHTYFTCVLTL